MKRPRPTDLARTLPSVLRVLDVDLDFFLEGAAHWRGRDAGRLDGDDYPPWPIGEALPYLRERCGLTERLPGIVVEHHAELFARWHTAIDAGTLEAPFSVTHVDAHADLGLGDAGYEYLLTSLLFEPPERREPGSALEDGNYLAFAIGCRWPADLTYVYSDGGGDDIPAFVMENYDPSASRIQLAAVTKQELQQLVTRGENPRSEALEPAIPFRAVPWYEFRAEAPFDVICLARSPSFTPTAADRIFDAIRERFIDETVFPPPPPPRRRHSREW